MQRPANSRVSPRWGRGFLPNQCKGNTNNVTDGNAIVNNAIDANATDANAIDANAILNNVNNYAGV